MSSRLSEIVDEVYDAVDSMALRVGALLVEARDLNPRGFKQWVETELPFSYETARRLVAIHLSYSQLPAEVMNQLPRPWQALYALRHWTGGRLQEAISSGEVHSKMTRSQAEAKARDWSKNDVALRQRGRQFSNADLAAGKLMAFDVNDLSAPVARALRKWVSHD